MLEFAGGVGLGMDVGDLLELQRPLHGHGQKAAAAQKQGMMLV